VLSYRGFVSIDGRFASLEGLRLLQSDMKDLNKAMTALEIDVALLKDKAVSEKRLHACRHRPAKFVQ
jgi:hypothetical protein